MNCTFQSWPNRHQLRSVIALSSALVGMMLGTPAQAGRPLSSDDASTAEAGTCQVETWHQKAGADSSWVVAPACGVLPGLEIGGDHTLYKPKDPLRASASLGVKWVPEALQFDTSMGKVALGVKAGVGFDHFNNESWKRSTALVLGLASLEVSDAVAVHLNVGPMRDRASGETGTLLNLAATWKPQERVLLFAEVQTNDRRSMLGDTVRTAGGRWWLLPETLGLDLTASRCSCGGPTNWTVGIGWYGIKF